MFYTILRFLSNELPRNLAGGFITKFKVKLLDFNVEVGWLGGTRDAARMSLWW